MTSYSLTNSIPYPKTAFLKFPRIALKLFWIFSFTFVVFLLIFYVFQVNALVKEGYLFQSHEQKFAELREENKILEINFAKANSLPGLEERINNLNFIETGGVKYIQLLGSQVATK